MQRKIWQGLAACVLLAVAVSEANAQRLAISPGARARRVGAPGVSCPFVYLALGEQSTRRQTRRVSKGVKSNVPEEVIRELPPALRAVVTAPRILSVDLDRERRRLLKAYAEALRQSEAALAALADETGGRIWLPASADEMIADGSARR